MTPERWERVKRIFEAALEREPPSRAAFLESACQGDGELRAEVERRLAENDVAGSFLEKPILARANRRPLAPGTRLGHYEILSAIGAGGMGEVYRARDTRLGRTVALKVLPDDFANDRSALDRFQREARAASLLNHPNICTLHDIGEADGRPFLTMEYLEGQTLRHRIAGNHLFNTRRPRTAILPGWQADRLRLGSLWKHGDLGCR